MSYENKTPYEDILHHIIVFSKCVILSSDILIKHVCVIKNRSFVESTAEARPQGAEEVEKPSYATILQTRLRAMLIILNIRMIMTYIE